MGFKDFFAVAAVAVVAVSVPVQAQPTCHEAQAWVEANKDQLPTRYDDVVAHPLAYRKAIFQASSPAVRSQLWVEHLNRYRATHPGLSAEQLQVIEEAIVLVSAGLPVDQDRQADAVKHLRERALKAFGGDGARELIATLGPSPEPTAAPAMAPQPDCECNTIADWCKQANPPMTCWYYTSGCNYSQFGCGDFWSMACHGRCHYN